MNQLQEISSSKEPHSNMADKVVIYRLGTLGDTVVALPCFHLIARSFPNAARLILTNEVPSSGIAQPLSILSGSGLVHEFDRLSTWATESESTPEFGAHVALFRSGYPHLFDREQRYRTYFPGCGVLSVRWLH